LHTTLPLPAGDRATSAMYRAMDDVLIAAVPGQSTSHG
jgi:hypothetical protein